MLPNPQFPADLLTFTEEIRHGKLYFLCSDLRLADQLMYCHPLTIEPL